MEPCPNWRSRRGGPDRREYWSAEKTTWDDDQRRCSGYSVASTPNTKEGFLVAVPQRNATTLRPIVQQFIRSGTTVVSDLWTTYNTIGNIGYRHLTVNIQVNFVNPVTGANTNTVENIWMLAKRRNKKCGKARGMVDTYVIEFMSRLKFGENPFENIIKDIRGVYPV